MIIVALMMAARKDDRMMPSFMDALQHALREMPWTIGAAKSPMPGRSYATLEQIRRFPVCP